MKRDREVVMEAEASSKTSEALLQDTRSPPQRHPKPPPRLPKPSCRVVTRFGPLQRRYYYYYYYIYIFICIIINIYIYIYMSAAEEPQHDGEVATRGRDKAGRRLLRQRARYIISYDIIYNIV